MRECVRSAILADFQSNMTSSYSSSPTNMDQQRGYKGSAFPHSPAEEQLEKQIHWEPATYLYSHFHIHTCARTHTQPPHLNLHCLGLDDMDFVLIATPDSIIHDSHAADGMVGVTQVHQVIVAEIPLTI